MSSPLEETPAAAAFPISAIMATGALTIMSVVVPGTMLSIAACPDTSPPDGTILAVRVEDLGEKEAVLAAQPKSFFTIPHFDGYSAVLIQLKTVTKRALQAAIIDGWLACAPSKLAETYVEQESPKPRRRP